MLHAFLMVGLRDFMTAGEGGALFLMLVFAAALYLRFSILRWLVTSPFLFVYGAVRFAKKRAHTKAKRLAFTLAGLLAALALSAAAWVIAMEMMPV